MSSPGDAATSTHAADRAELWREYNDKQLERRVLRPLLLDALEQAGTGDGRIAVELGCGAGVESAELARRGWRVIAIDGAPGTDERIAAVTAGDDPAVRAAIEARELDLESETLVLPSADLIYSGYTLPYVHPTVFPRVWRSIVAALQPGGLLAVELFGDRDSYVGEPDWSFHTKADAEELLRGVEVLSFVEEEKDGMAMGGPKHWHVFHIIARRRD